MSHRPFDFTEATHSEIRDLVERAVAGSAEAGRVLVDGIAPIVHLRVARALWKRRSEAKGRDVRQELEDLIQEVFVALFAKRGRALVAWDPSRGRNFLSFVGFLAERSVSVAMRTRKHHPWTEDPTAAEALLRIGGATDSGEAHLEARDLLQVIGQRLAERVSPQGLQYLRLLFVEERSVQSIAEETGASSASLYAWRSRLGRLLRELAAEIAGDTVTRDRRKTPPTRRPRATRAPAPPRARARRLRPSEA